MRKMDSQPDHPKRKINKEPYKVLDAPNLIDDYYLNLLDWSNDNVLAIGLDNAVYIWRACNSKVEKLCEVPDTDQIASVSWSSRSNQIAVGNTMGEIDIFDTQKKKIVRTFEGHLSRVGSLAWNDNIIASGSRDRAILLSDIRAKRTSQIKFISHKQEICGLKWSFDQRFLASGGNDNKLIVWSLKMADRLHTFS